MEFSPWTEITRQQKPQKRLHCTNENPGRCKILKYLQTKRKENNLIGNERKTGNISQLVAFSLNLSSKISKDKEAFRSSRYN